MRRRKKELVREEMSEKEKKLKKRKVSNDGK